MEKKDPAQGQQKKKHSFEKADRLLKSTEFDCVFKKAEKKLSNNYFLLLALTNQHKSARLGLVVAKKKIPLAVQRNSFKRTIKEEFRKNKNNLRKMDIIILAKENKKKIIKKELRKEIEILFQQLVK